MTKTTKRILIGAALMGAGYAAWRLAIKPRVVAMRANKITKAKKDFDASIIQNLEELKKNLSINPLFKP